MTVQAVNVQFRTTYSGRGTKEFKRDLNTLGADVRKVSSSAGQSFTAFGKFSQAAGTALMVGVGAALAVGIKAAIDFESAFAGVRKTLDASEGTFERLAQDIRDMALEIPIAATELAKIGEMGAQLGIPASGLTEFIEVVAKMGVATNLGTEEAATALARFANVMGSTDDEFENIASSVVELGNNFATTEAEIFSFGGRLSGIGATIGLTEGDVLGLSAAFTSLGEPAERGATAVQRVFVEMFEAVSQGGEELQIFADVLGVTADEFVALFQADPAMAFLRFSEGLGEIIDNGGDVVTLLNDLDLGSQRTLAAMLKAATSSEILAEGIEMGNQAFEESIALNEEAEKRFGTMASQITLLGNQFTDLRIEIGNKAAPAFRDVLGFAGAFMELIKENMGVLQGFAVLVATLAGARGLVKLGTAFSSVMIAMGQNLGMQGMANRGIKLMDTMGGLAGAARFLGGAIGGAAIAIGLIGVAMAHNRQLANEYRDAIGNLADAVADYTEGTGNATTVTEALGEVLAQKTGIFDFTVILDDNKDLLHDLGISVNTFATLAVTDMEEFDERMRTILAGHFGLDDAEITRLFENGFRIGGDPGQSPITGMDPALLDDFGAFLELMRETEAAVASLRKEEALRRKEHELEMVQVIGEGPGDISPESIAQGLSGILDSARALTTGLFVTQEEYGDFLVEMLGNTQQFSDDFISEWTGFVGEFNDQMFDWSTALEGYEQATALSTSKMQTSIANWVADMTRRSEALAFVAENFGTEFVSVFAELPLDVQLGLGATLAEMGPEAFTTQFNSITGAWQTLMGLSLANAISMAPLGAQNAFDSWTTFFNEEISVAMEEIAPEGSDAWLEAVVAQMALFQDELSPELATEFNTLLNSAIDQMEIDLGMDDIEKITAGMTTTEKILYFHSIGFDWATAIALGFAVLPGKLATITASAAASVNTTGKAKMKVSSPSKMSEEWGKWVALGFGVGLEKWMPVAMNSLIPFTKVPFVGLPQATTQPAPNGPSITIINPQHKDDDVLDGVKRAATLVGLTRSAEVTPGFN